MEFVFNQKLSELDKIIISLKSALERTKQEKKELVSQHRLVEKALDTFKNTVEKISWSGEALEYLKSQILGLIPGNQVQKNTVSELTDRPAKENKSNDFFSWQPTSNEAISNYFNVTTGKVKATYIGSNSQQNLETLESKLIQWLPGISTSIRKAKYLPFTYELKILRIDDNTINWLTGFDFSKPISPQLKSELPTPVENNNSSVSATNNTLVELLDSDIDETEDIVVESQALDKNILPSPRYSIVKLRISHDNLCYQVLGKGGTKDFIKVWNLSTGKEDRIRAKDLEQVELPSSYKFWQEKVTITIDDPIFECLAIYYRWRFSCCQKLEEFEKLKQENPCEINTLKWTYKHLPDDERRRIDLICQRTPEKEKELSSNNLKSSERLQTSVDVKEEIEHNTIEFSEIIAQIDDEFARLGCQKEQRIDYVEKKYGVRSRHKLTDEQIFDLLSSLKALRTRTQEIAINY
ncbi:MAG: hypothetical protein QNJ54_23520 [Prochloraceae cyanobacterium]|nr:hypothetical protein [Prochloraceae cyanobacterium]